jgi:hypothetical protein
VLDAARDTYDAIVADYGVGQASAEEVYTWSSRWRAASLRAAKSNEEVLQANTKHLERMRLLHRQVKALYEASAKGGELWQYRASEFYVAEAELLLVDPKSNVEVQPTPKVPDR